MSKLTRVRIVDAEGQPTSAGQPDRISRRGFLRGVGAAGLAVAGASGVVSLLTGCGGETQSTTPIPNIGGLSGVVQSSTGVDISGATVTITGGSTNRSTITDINGAFLIQGILAGTYVLTITKTGYNTLTISNFVIGTGPISRVFNLIPVGSTTIVSSATTVSIPANFVTPANSTLNFPGAPFSPVGINLSSVSPFAQGQLENSATGCVPVTDRVLIGVTSGTLANSNFAAGQAPVLHLPLLIYPLPAGAMVDVYVGNRLSDDLATGSRAVGIGTVSSNGMFIDIPLGQIADTFKGGLFYVEAAPFCLSSGSISTTMAAVTHANININNCTLSATTRSLTEPNNKSMNVTASLVSGGSLTVTPQLQELIANAFGSVAGTTQTLIVPIAANSHGTISQVEDKYAYHGSGSGTIGGGANAIAINFGISGGFSLWVSTPNLTTCSATGSTGGTGSGSIGGQNG